MLRTIVLTFQDSSHALTILHSDLDAVLAESSFPATLDSVIFEFDVRSPAGRDGDERVIMGRFPTLGKIGLLQGMSPSLPHFKPCLKLTDALASLVRYTAF